MNYSHSPLLLRVHSVRSGKDEIADDYDDDDRDDEEEDPGSSSSSFKLYIRLSKIAAVVQMMRCLVYKGTQNRGPEQPV